MDSQIVFYTLFFIIVLINLSFIFKADLWRNFQLYTLKKEEKFAKNILWYSALVAKEIKFAKGKYGLWLFRGIGIVWLLYTIYLLLSLVRPMR